MLPARHNSRLLPGLTMVLMKSRTAIILLATFIVADSARIGAPAAEERQTFVLHPHIVSQNDMGVTRESVVWKHLGDVPGEVPSNFSKTLHHILSASWYSRNTILRTACDSSAFSCEEIMQLADNCQPWLGPYVWQQVVILFAKGRKNKGCISDPASVQLIVGSFESKWPYAVALVAGLQ